MEVSSWFEHVYSSSLVRKQFVMKTLHVTQKLNSDEVHSIHIKGG